MKLDKVYDFFLLPLSERHSLVEKIFSSITVLALTVLTSGIYLIPLGIAYWKNRHVVVLTPQNPNAPSNPLTPQTTKVEEVKKNISEPTPKIDEIKRAHHKQLQQFEEWAQKGDWKRFTPHYSHYDWWVFPIQRASSLGTKYSVNDAEIQILKNDTDFMAKYRRGVELVLNSWGWDPIQNQEIPLGQKTPDQKWEGYGVRLGKMADSLYLFGEKELYSSVQKFSQTCCYRANVTPLEGWVIQNLSRNFN